MLRWLLAVIALGVLLAATSHGHFWRLPDRHDPWAPFAIEEPPGWLTRHKLSRLDAEPALCQDVLATARMRAEPVADRVTGPQCGFSNAVRISRTSLALNPPFVLSCRSAVSLAAWEHHVVLPAAHRWLGQPAARMEHFGSYACRNVYGWETGTRSRHATADAVDISGFVMADGQGVTVARHWASDGPESRFLREIHDGACVFFNGVLGPEYNRAHADHFHLDRGSYRVCR